MDSTPTRKPQFGHQVDGLASIADVADSSLGYSVIPRRGKPHFLEACDLCRKSIGGNKDIYMYRGDTPFCSEECREEQIEIDEAKENENQRKVLRKKLKKSNSTSAQGYHLRTGTVAAA